MKKLLKCFLTKFGLAKNKTTGHIPIYKYYDMYDTCHFQFVEVKHVIVLWNCDVSSGHTKDLHVE
jgi:hypothetical protein